jgi:mono/diheme cytochrome c family protein
VNRSFRAALLGTLLFIFIVLAAGACFVISGSYDVGADVPHAPATFLLIEELREHSIARRAGSIAVPPLDDPSLVAAGAEHYAAMCTGCHLAPGMEGSELRAGLYPQPPKLAASPAMPAAQQFWVIKHGIKLTAMPAWGTTHDDAAIWRLVAFLQQLPGMSEQRYRELTANGHHHHDETDHPDEADHPGY